MKRRKSLIPVITMMIAVLCLMKAYQTGFLKLKIENNIKEKEICFDVMENVPLMEYQEAYTALVEAVQKRKTLVVISADGKEKQLMEYFIEMNPLAGLVTSYQSDNNQSFQLEYRYQARKHNSAIKRMKKEFEEVGKTMKGLGDNQFSQVLSVYRNIASSCKYKKGKADFLYETLLSGKANEGEFSKLCVFTLLQECIPVHYVKSTKDKRTCFVAELMGDWYYFYPAEESMYTQGEGLTYFAASENHDQELFGETDYVLAFDSSTVPTCEADNLYACYTAHAYEPVGENTLLLFQENDTVIILDTNTLEVKKEKS